MDDLIRVHRTYKKWKKLTLKSLSLVIVEGLIQMMSIDL